MPLQTNGKGTDYLIVIRKIDQPVFYGEGRKGKRQSPPLNYRQWTRVRYICSHGICWTLTLLERNNTRFLPLNFSESSGVNRDLKRSITTQCGRAMKEVRKNHGKLNKSLPMIWRWWYKKSQRGKAGTFKYMQLCKFLLPPPHTRNFFKKIK